MIHGSRGGARLVQQSNSDELDAVSGIATVDGYRAVGARHRADVDEVAVEPDVRVEDTIHCLVPLPGQAPGRVD